MAQQTINIGSTANDGTGDDLRSGGDKINDNFTEIYARWTELSGDATPQLGGNLDVNGNSIVSASAGNIAITPDTTGSIVLDGLSWPQADGTNGQVLSTDGAGALSWATVGGGTVDVVSNVATSTILGRVTAGSGDSEELTATQVRTLLNVEDGADVTDATNVDAAGATMNTDADVSANSWVLDEDTMTSNSATKVPTQQSVKAYVDANAGGASKATTSEILNGTDNVYVSPAGIDAALALVTLTDAASVAWDMDTGRNFKVTLGGNRTMAAPSNITAGRTGVLQVIQDGTGSRTLTWNAAYEFVDGTAPTLSTTAGETDTFSYFCPDASTVQVAHIGVFS